MREKRRYVRIGTRIAVVYSLASDGSGGESVARRGIIDSLSLGGALLATEERLEKDSIVTLRIPISSMADNVTAQAIVLRSDPDEESDQYLSAVEFRDVPFEDARRIGGLVDRQLSQLISTFEDLTEHLDLLREFSRTTSQATDIREALDILIDSALRATGAEAGSVMILDSTGEWLNFVCVRGPKAKELEKFRIRVGDGIAGLIARYERPLNVPDPHQDQRWRSDIATAIDFETRCLLGVPFVIAGHVAGVVQVLNKRGAARFSSEDLRLLDALATQAAVAVQNLRLWAALKGALPELPHLPLGPEPLPKERSRIPEAVAAAAQGSLAVCLSGCEHPAFSGAAQELLGLVDPSGAVKASVEHIIRSALSSKDGVSGDGTTKEVELPGGGTLCLRFVTLASDNGKLVGLVAYLEAHETTER